MTSAPTRARRTGLPLAARWVVLGGLLALALVLGMGFAHASAGGSASMASDATDGLHHGPALTAVAADADCPGCIDHDEGAMIACLVTIVVVALMSALRPAPVVWLAIRQPLATTAVRVPPGPVRPPDLSALGICRT
ncbi:DUF6153 family protein [Demequina activiva]|uniref:Uncharacterized protein n=1 Tax=Demequina activiva TaxID=1582364 RepID=A0A919Q609_9MICO|nr:DUF6153 family protein [Demequina activiva]GIG55163.1 hypothetical protein Dac01nite_19150 [Demequina activiva]